jgi:hypothetical protein
MRSTIAGDALTRRRPTCGMVPVKPCRQELSPGSPWSPMNVIPSEETTVREQRRSRLTTWPGTRNNGAATCFYRNGLGMQMTFEFTAEVISTSLLGAANNRAHHLHPSHVAAVDAAFSGVGCAGALS